ncbi:MAG TPA: ABC transporter permease [Gemmatimonadaceae bacterium]|jgi:predicted permease
MHQLVSDVRLALRRARRRPGFTLVALLSLTLGIGANTAVFSLVDAILLRRAPIPHLEEIAEVSEDQPGYPFSPFSIPDYVDFKRAAAGTFSQISTAQFAIAARDMGDHVESLMGELVNGDYFPLLGLKPEVGRLLGREDDVAPGAHPVVVLSYDYWQRAFNRDRTVVGRAIRLSGRQYTIVGVAPREYNGTISGVVPAVFVPLLMINQLQPDIRDQLTQRGAHSGFMKARLAPGVSMAQARSMAAAFAADMRNRYPSQWVAGTGVSVIPETSIAVNPLLDSVVVPAAAALMSVVGLVLLVACANLASFLLAQARDRRKEVAIRLAIGAKRSMLVRQFLVESLLLAAVGGVLGVVVSVVALRAVLRTDFPLPVPITLDVSLDWRVLSFTVLASAVAGVLFGLLPALQVTRASVVETIKNENAEGGPSGRFTVRNALVVGQVAVSLTLLITAMLFLRSLQARTTVDPGFGRVRAGMLWIAIPTDRYDSTRRLQLLDDVERRMAQIPGVASVGAVDNIYLNPLNQQSKRIHVPGVTPPKGQTAFDVDFASADSGFLGSIGLEVVRGRGITAADGPAAPLVAVINEAMANTFWPGKEAIGQTFSTDSSTFRVVGITRTTKVRTLGEAPRPFFLMSLPQEFSATMMLVARTNGNDERTTTQMLAALREVDPGIMTIQAKTMAKHLAAMLLPARLGAMAFMLFAGLALALAVLGVYGVVSYAVARRTREVGIRLAVGAQPNALVRLLMGEGFALVAMGAALGLLLGFGSAAVLGSLLYGVRAGDPMTFVGAPVLLMLVGALAAFLPARRASRVDPASVLRAE